MKTNKNKKQNAVPQRCEFDCRVCNICTGFVRAPKGEPHQRRKNEKKRWMEEGYE